MIKAAIIFGGDATRYYNETGLLPSSEWLMDNGGVVQDIEFPTKAEYDAYVQGVSDAHLWDNYHVIPKANTPDSLHVQSYHEQVKPNLPPFRDGDFVRLTDDAIAEIRRIFGDTPADYRGNMLLQVKYVRQNSADSSWHIGVQDIHEDDVQEFDSNFLRSATADDISSLSCKERFYAFIWNCWHLKRTVSDAELLDAWRNGPSRSAIDEEDETEYEVERLTLDESAERINDEHFNDTEDYIGFIQMTD